MSDAILDLSPAELARLPASELEELKSKLEDIYWSAGKSKFLEFYQRIEIPGAPMDEPEPDVYYPSRLQPAAHHRLLIGAIQNVADGTWGDVDGILALAPPGSAKSTVISVAAPGWLMGRAKGTNVIGGSYGQDLANRFGRRVRSIVRSDEYARIMGCTITGDNQAVDAWSLTNASDYRAAGTGASVTGFRADWAFLDDPIKGRAEADSQLIRDKVWDWWNDDFITRLKPGGKLCMVLTHWHEDDPAGRILGEDWKGQSGLWRGTDGRLWHIINLPMIAEHDDDPLGRKKGQMLWPEWYKEKEILRLQAQAAKGGTAARTWSSLYQQRPAPADGSILLRSYWKRWKEPEPPECDFILLAYDTAFEAEEENDESAMTAWGIFPSVSRKSTGEEYHHHHAILLGAWSDRVQAVDLADIIQDHYRQMKPDLIIVEKRASGHTVLQELKRLRLPVKAWLPRGRPGTLGKVPRAHGIAMMLEQGAIHYIPGVQTEKVIAQCAAFPNGANDDLVDTVTSALSFFRDRFMFRTADEEPDDDDLRAMMERKRMAMYGKIGGERRLYGGPAKGATRAGQNERRLYGGKVEVDTDDPVTKRMTETSKRRLYGG